MGKQGKKHHGRSHSRLREDDDPLPSSAYDSEPPQQQHPLTTDEFPLEEEEKEEKYKYEEQSSCDLPSKFVLYQRSVQSPKGDISYMQKFFWTYVGGRLPLHLREDFCGTALISAEWLRSDSRRTAVGVDLDIEALTWGLENNVQQVGADAYSRICLFHGNVLHSLTNAKCIKSASLGSENYKSLRETEDSSGSVTDDDEADLVKRLEVGEHVQDYCGQKESSFPAADIVCAFNYSCCCLQSRSELVLYFKQAWSAISKKGGIFVMDLYGGTSSEHALKLRRRYEDFMYVWEQEDFNIINRTTKISLHFYLSKNQRSLRYAFSYHWRLWTLPEIKDCLEEAGFNSVHFWMREMPNIQERREVEDFEVNDNVKYEEISSFNQKDAWNAYIVGIANKVEKRS